MEKRRFSLPARLARTGSIAEAKPAPSVGGSVPAESAAVDLGLTSGTLWAPWNVGATKPGEAGAYFAWGETTAKENYDGSTYKHMKEGESDQHHINKYTIEDNICGDWYTRTFIGDGMTTLDETDDAAAANWGGGWRMPTLAQLQELSDYCTQEWKEADWDANGSLAGCLLTGPNGKKLFLPAAGDRRCSDLYEVGSHGRFWSAELDSDNSDYARNLSFTNLYSGTWYEGSNDWRHFGFSVRPVCHSAETTKAYNTPDVSVGGQVPTVAEAVDLGLPSGTLWAPYNVGATKPGEAGAYLAWGETATKESYDLDTYKHMKEGKSDFMNINKYTLDDGQMDADWYTDVKFVGDGKTTLEVADDAAAQNWGGNWRMPTQDQFYELFSECTSEWKEAGWDANGSLAGYLLTGPNGKRLFIPAAGGRRGSDLYDVGSYGRFWSAELDSGYSTYASLLVFPFSDDWEVISNRRFEGCSVRPVCPSAE
ncbi:MAG: hypothetical protein ACI35Q_05030 [Marinilabiliaceae bacterium]